MTHQEKIKRVQMRDLEKITDFSRATINFYIREGILPIPQKSAKNMAYYDQDFIQKLDKVRKYKNSGFSLGQIKQFMHAEQSMDREFVIQALRNINNLLPSRTKDSFITVEQIKSIGFDDDGIKELIQMNLIAPIAKDGTVFPAYIQEICEFVKYFLDLGIPLTIAKSVVQKIMELSRIETEAFMTYIRQPMIEKNATLEQQSQAIQDCIEKVNVLLPMINLQLLKLPAENQLKNSL
jgi:DNA-binding transcriptional MerR regulator